MASGPGKYLFIVSSSYGHLFPAIRLAHLLQRRGKDVLFVADREHRLLFDVHGIKVVVLPGSANPFLSTHDWYDPEVAARNVSLLDRVVEHYQPDAIVASQLAMPAFVLAEIRSLPLTVIGYCEYLYPSVGERDSPKQWRIESISGHYNNLRARLGLPPVAPDPARTPLIGDKYLLRSVPQLSGQAGLPACVEMVGALLWEPRGINLDLERFVAQGRERQRPLFMLQIGRLFEEPQRWDTLIEGLGQLPTDFVVDLARADYLKSHREFPANFYLHPFISLAGIADAVAGMICSGQTTSVLSALQHGKPILGVPNSGDGAELTRRITEHGLGAGIYHPHEQTAAAFSRFVAEVGEGRFTEASRRYQAYFHEHDQDQRIFERSFA